MTISDYQTIMLPLLKLASDNNEHRFQAMGKSGDEGIDGNIKEDKPGIPGRMSGTPRLNKIRKSLMGSITHR